MEDLRKLYIDGRWVDPTTPRTLDVINPADEKPFATISIGSAADVDKAVAAARRAFETYSLTTREERIALLSKIVEVYARRQDEVALRRYFHVRNYWMSPPGFDDEDDF